MSDGSEEDLASQVTWASAADATATVDDVGVVAGVAASEVEITATLVEVVGTTTMDVFVPVPITLVVSRPPLRAVVLDGSQLAAGGSDITDLTTVVSPPPTRAVVLETTQPIAGDAGVAIAIARAIATYPADDVAARKRIVRDPRAPAALQVAAAAATAGQLASDGVSAAQVDLTRWTPAELWPTPLLNGDRLRAAGHRPGPAFKIALTALEDAQLAGHASDEERAWRVVDEALGAAGRDAPG